MLSPSSINYTYTCLYFPSPCMALSTLPGISLSPLTFNKVHFLCNCTHTRYGMNACFVRGCVYFYASVYCVHACLCVYKCDAHRVPIQTASSGEGVKLMKAFSSVTPLSELYTHTHTHTLQQIHYIRSKTNFTKHFRHCPDCGSVQLLVHLSWRLRADSGCLSAPLTHSRKTFP